MKNMKNILIILRYCIALFCGLLWQSCQKDEIQQQENIAKVNVINAVVSSAGMLASRGDVKANISTKEVSWSSISNDSYLGQWQISRMFIVPTSKSTVLQVVPISDSTKMWYDDLLQLSSGKVYTLYLSGTPTNVKTRFQEEINVSDLLRDVRNPETAADSMVNIRFVNLSPSGPKVSINIVNSSVLEASNLGYQEFTNFKAFSARSSSPIRFEIRNSVDKSLVMTYDFYTDYNRFRSISLVLKGVYPVDYSLPYTSLYNIAEVPY